MAYKGKIDEAAIYLSSGNPLPSDIDAMVQALLNQSFKVRPTHPPTHPPNPNTQKLIPTTSSSSSFLAHRKTASQPPTHPPTHL